ncbi:MAG TPA: alpha/beta hydrolase-fold protein [Acidimicrobiia bacterium]|nr:alpha/beta hydrolase-fold protein [Acidimicrobiia bacterium]
MGFERHRVTWWGRADEVTLITFMPRFPHRLPLSGNGRGWFVDLHLPADARIEYRLEVRRGDVTETTLDPANDRVASNPYGHNSVLSGSEYPSPTPGPSIEWRSREFRVPSVAFGGRRHHRLLSPSDVGDQEPLPLVMLHDGSDHLVHGAIAPRLGAAIRSGALPPLRVALLDPRRRHDEYTGDPHHAAHVALEVLPHVAKRVAVDDRRVLGGSSLGAVAAWHAAHSHPGIFTGLILQSGTFAFTRHPEVSPDMARPIGAFLEAAVAAPRAECLAIAQTCGRFESLVDWNRRAAAVLSGAADLHRYEERWTGHDWGAWGDMLPAALAFALRE